MHASKAQVSISPYQSMQVFYSIRFLQLSSVHIPIQIETEIKKFVPKRDGRE